MDYIPLFIASLSIGIVLIIVSIFVSKKKDEKEKIEKDVEVASITMQLEKSIEEADGTMEQLSKMSTLIMDEIENKYKELLFLYQLVDEKKVEVDKMQLKIESATANLTIANPIISAYAPPTKPVATVDTMLHVEKPNKPDMLMGKPTMEEINSSSIPERFENVVALYKEGKDISDIARELNMGQGEIKLILGLGKMR